MASEAPTIAETIADIQAALRDYIEATYHVGHPSIIEQRRELLRDGGRAVQGAVHREHAALSDEPHVRRPRTRRRGARAVRHCSRRRSAQLDRLLYDPPYTHQAEALESTSRDGKSLAITTGTGSGKTESFLLPMLAKLADRGRAPTRRPSPRQPCGR